MKSQELTLYEVLIRECGELLLVDTLLDIKTIKERVESQGFSFLTISLPAFGAAFERGLDVGAVDPSDFTGFRKVGALPVFLGGFLDLVFDRSSGSILDEPSIEAIRVLRQLTLMWGKVKLECTPERVRNAARRYVECELELRQRPVMPHDVMSRFDAVGALLFGEVFRKLDLDVANFSLIGKHGPGATADRLIANAKYDFPRWSVRAEEVFPHWRYATSRGYSVERYESVGFYEPGAEPPVKVVFVPKTLKTPRVIAIEPTHMQFLQQGLLERFTEYVKEDPFLKHMIDTTHQEPNQLLAREGSLTGALATLDLSEASDRVLNSDVMRLMRRYPHLNDGVQACRSTTASVPTMRPGSDPEVDRVVIPLSKFASMGSALCFPVEMMVFLTIVFMGIEDANGTLFRRRADFKPFIGSVRVYGDDLVVPVSSTTSVRRLLALFGSKVNDGKSFWTGRFRESCGKEYFAGHDVTLTRVREMFPATRRDVEQVVSTVSFRNLLAKAGYKLSVQWLDDNLTKIIPMPTVGESSQVLGKTSLSGIVEGEKFCPKLHRPMVRGVVAKYRPRRSKADGDAALMKFFLKRGDEPIFDPNHLLYAGRPISSELKYGWFYSD